MLQNVNSCEFWAFASSVWAWTWRHLKFPGTRKTGLGYYAIENASPPSCLRHTQGFRTVWGAHKVTFSTAGKLVSIIFARSPCKTRKRNQQLKRGLISWSSHRITLADSGHGFTCANHLCLRAASTCLPLGMYRPQASHVDDPLDTPIHNRISNQYSEHRDPGVAGRWPSWKKNEANQFEAAARCRCSRPWAPRTWTGEACAPRRVPRVQTLPPEQFLWKFWDFSCFFHYLFSSVCHFVP